MARIKPSKEAPLKEVLAEVSLVDVGGMLKRGLATIGCFGIFYAVIFFFTTASEATGYTLENFGIPDWVVWLILAWIFAYSATSERSYHYWKVGWYFPKLNWFSSLLLSAYLLGFAYLAIWAGNMELGPERMFSAFFGWILYPTPFIFFLTAINTGHAKLMEKRSATDE